MSAGRPVTGADEAALRFLLAESGVRQLYGRYADALWRKDEAAFVACFAADAVWKIAGRTLAGRDAIAALLRPHLETAHRIMLFAGIPVVDLAGDGAIARVPVTEYIKPKTGEAVRTLGVYYDRLVVEDGCWRFASHHFNLYYHGPNDFSEPYYECREYGPPPGMPGPGEPTTVRRPS